MHARRKNNFLYYHVYHEVKDTRLPRCASEMVSKIQAVLRKVASRYKVKDVDTKFWDDMYACMKYRLW